MKITMTRRELDVEHGHLYLLRKVEDCQKRIKRDSHSEVRISDILAFRLDTTVQELRPDRLDTMEKLNEIMQRHLRAALAEMHETIISRMTVQLAD